MRIAYFIAVHKEVAQINALFNLIHDDRDTFLFHIDKKAPENVHLGVEKLVHAHDNVYLLNSAEVNWAGWSQCRVEINALKYLCGLKEAWDYYINLSGQDLPICPISEIRRFLTESDQMNYIDVRAIDKLPDRLRRVVSWRSRLACVEMKGKARRLPLPNLSFFRGKVRYYGSNWHIFNRRFCDWMVESSAWGALEPILRHTRSPDESLFQEIVMKSPFRDRIFLDNKRLAIFDGQPNPSILKLKDYDRVLASKAWFARKFDLKVDAEMVAAISRHVDARVAPSLAAASS